MKNRLIYIFLLVIWVEGFGQNTFTYNMYDLVPGIYNPAEVGITQNNYFSLLHKEQWLGLDGAPNQSIFNMQTFFEKQRLGAGFSVGQFQSGPLQNTELNIDIAYHLQVSENMTLSTGLKGSLDIWNMNLLDINQFQSDPVLYGDDTKSTKGNLGAGLNLYTDRWEIGIAVPFFISNYDDDTEAYGAVGERIMFVNASYRFKLSETLQLKPRILFQQAQVSGSEIDFWVESMWLEKFKFSALYRSTDELGLVLGWEINDQFYIGYSYSQNLGELSNTSSGSHEFGLRYQFNKKTKSN
jgi:type IX secretion system PorP/SprF family membrane protein